MYVHPGGHGQAAAITARPGHTRCVDLSVAIVEIGGRVRLAVSVSYPEYIRAVGQCVARLNLVDQVRVEIPVVGQVQADQDLAAAVWHKR